MRNVNATGNNSSITLSFDSTTTTAESSEPGTTIDDTAFERVRGSGAFAESWPDFIASAESNWKPTEQLLLLEKKRVRVTLKNGTGFIRTIKHIEGPSTKYEHGRMISSGQTLGHELSGSTALEKVKAVEVLEEPDEREKNSYERYVGKDVRLHFKSAGHESARGGEQVYSVIGISDERDLYNHPYGGLQVEAFDDDQETVFRSGIVGFELLSHVEIIDPKVDAIQGGRASGTKGRRKRKKPSNPL